MVLFCFMRFPAALSLAIEKEKRCKRMANLYLTFVCILVLLLSGTASAAKPSVHPHEGVLGAHAPGLPEDVELTSGDLKDLKAGKPGT